MIIDIHHQIRFRAWTRCTFAALRIIDIVSRFVTIIKSVNFGSRGLLKVRISMQNQQFENPSNQFFDSKGPVSLELRLSSVIGNRPLQQQFSS
jgi:hypothetical protein